jgi:four helix bundle protein
MSFRFDNANNTNTNINAEPGCEPTRSKFIALEVSYELIEALAKLVPVIARPDRDLADQIRRAASSVSLNLAEGQRSMKGNRQKHYSIAHGSANEVKAGLRVAKAWGWIGADERALAVLDRLLALLWRLTQVNANVSR